MFAGNVGRVGRQTPMGGVGGASLPSMELNFLGSEVLDPRIAFTRANPVATRFNSGGVLETIGANLPRFDYDPTTVTTNVLPNSTMQGAVQGVPGTPPTGWTPAAGGLAVSCVGKGTTLEGFAFVDYRFSGIASANFGQIPINPNGVVPAVNSQTWNSSLYLALVGGSLTNVTAVTTTLNMNDAALISLGSITAVPNCINTISSTLTRFTGSNTLNQAATAWLRNIIGFGWPVSSAIDFTIRIAAPQLELGSSASTYIPTTGAAASGNGTPRGLLIEEARTNSVANSTMVGASAPSTLPTTWGGTDGLSAGVVNGITTTVEGTGTESGIPYIDYRMQGTAIATSGAFYIRFSLSTAIAALNGQIWTNSVYLRVVGGSTANLSAIMLFIGERDVGGASLITTQTAVGPPTTAALATQRYTISRTNNNAATAFELGAVAFGFVIGLVYDFTIRVGAPQLELGAFQTSFIPTSTVAVTRAADVATIPVGPWFNQTQGTLVASYIPYGRAAAGAGVSPNVAQFDAAADFSQTIQMRLANTNGLQNTIFASGVGSNLTAAIGWLPDVRNTGGITYTATVQTVANNSSAVASQASGGLPALAMTRLVLGAGRSNYLNGTVGRVRYWPRALSDTQLRSETT